MARPPGDDDELGLPNLRLIPGDKKRTLADQITRILSTPAEQFSGPSGYRTPANLNEGGTFSTPAAQGTGLGILATPSEQGGVTGFADPIQQALGGTWQADWVEGPGRSGKFTGKLTPEQRKFLDQLGGKLGTVNVTDPYGQTGPMQDITWEKNVMANPQLRDIAAALGYTQGSRPDIEQWNYATKGRQKKPQQIESRLGQGKDTSFIPRFTDPIRIGRQTFYMAGRPYDLRVGDKVLMPYELQGPNADPVIGVLKSFGDNFDAVVQTVGGRQRRVDIDEIRAFADEQEATTPRHKLITFPGKPIPNTILKTLLGSAAARQN